MPAEITENHLIKIKVTSELIYFILTQIKNISNLPENITLLKKSHENLCKNYFLVLDDIKWIKLHLSKYQHNSNKKVYIHELLHGIAVKLPEPKVIPRNPDLEARVKKLQALQDSEDYTEMTKNVDSSRKHLPDDTIAYQMRVINKQLIAVVQFIFSVIAGFTFGFIGLELIVGNLDFGFRLLLGIICALIIALAEIYFLAKKLSEDYNESPKLILKKLHQE